MAAPEKNVRIAPSGPLASAGESDPFAEYAGAQWRSDQGVVAPGTTAYMTARIGPVGSAHETRTFLKRGGAAPQTPPDANYLQSDMLPIGLTAPEQALNDGFGVGVGVWLCEAVISMGFNTSIPVGDTQGGLQATFALVDDANAVVLSAPAQSLDNTPRGVQNGTLTAVQAGLVHSTTFRQLVTVTAAEIAANANQPLRGYQLELVRGTGSGVYDANSGWLEFTRNCRLSIRRFR